MSTLIDSWGAGHVTHGKEAESSDKGMAAAVAADIKALDLAKIPGGYTNAALARWLAAEIDRCEGPASVVAKLADQLNKAMAALTKRGGGDGGDGFEDFSDDISTPVVEG